MALSEREKEMVAFGASIGGNCVPCLEYHFKKCVELGYSMEEVQEAFDMAKKVKESPNKEIYKVAARLIRNSKDDKPGGCCCADTDCC